ncbi:hypothetical protein NA57DRAFT_57165 [Rhizodiscina lignyota]|uniref:Uncharacterized protein n=1 Tax=Rhizodiscina lignyota TaxID=1504668 RepID=A0A9P4IEV8_9PEZI|nr:hypothetical protein NA57DRAFT_57165 [Rhizodiscina lignyota]
MAPRAEWETRNPGTESTSVDRRDTISPQKSPTPVPKPTHDYESSSKQAESPSPGEDTLVEVDAEDMEAGDVIERYGDEDMQNLFAGAPRFSTVSAHGTIQAQVSLPWDSDPTDNDTRDCTPIAHPTYSLSTQQSSLMVDDTETSPCGSKKGYDINVTELPSMLCAQGLENGSIGLCYFLQLPLSDSLNSVENADIDDNLSQEDDANRALFQSNPEGLGIRKPDLTFVSDRLAELSEMYQKCRTSKKANKILEKQLPDELHEILFQMLLITPDAEDCAEDSAKLKLQIEVLLKTLNIRGIWYDFSQVEWRIKLGQLLWGEQVHSSEPATPSGGRLLTEREIFLLQITLACELLVRLDALSNLNEADLYHTLQLLQQDMENFGSLQTNKSKWDLILAHRFLDNVLVKTTRRKEERRTSRQLRRFFSPFSTESPRTPEFDEYPDVLLLPRNQEKQLDGLKHFARSIAWSDLEALEFVLTTKFPPIVAKRPSIFKSPSIYATPLACPRARSPSQDTDYFNLQPRSSTPPRSRTQLRPQLSRGCSTQRSFQLQSPALFLTPPLVPALTNKSDRSSPPRVPDIEPQQMPTGWLTRAYLTGLILPGESLQHHLISALLENSPAAMDSLGATATLYGGFVYAKRSYWSRCCVVGRVLSCKKGSSDGWGWVGTYVIPTVNGKWTGEGWLDVAADEASGRIVGLATETTVRIEQKEGIERDSDVLAGNQISELKPDDFTLPVDAPNKPRPTLWFDGLRLQRQPDPVVLQQEDVDAQDDDFPPPATYKAFLAFSSMSLSSEIGSPTIPLQYDVYFISAVPCTPPTPEKLRLLHLLPENESVETEVSAHPLHVSQPYRVVQAGDLIKKSFKHPVVSDAGPSGSTTQEKEILVLDTRGSEELELLARAWCAWKGEHAVLGRVGVTCLACCVREARAAGVGVVIRVG